MRISVCICTYQRPVFLKRLLDGLKKQDTNGLFTYSVVVADNDSQKSAEPVVREFSKEAPCQVVYCVEPQKNIALVRNQAIRQADGDFIAFIDDDEFPEKNWLLELFKTCTHWNVEGVLGPVKPHFDQEPPAWIIKGGFYERPTHVTGFVMPWNECRTGNVIFRRSLLSNLAEPFNPSFAAGGEDVDFFRRMIQGKCVFIWCREAVVFETIPPNRWSSSFMIKRALLRGQTNIKHGVGYDLRITKSIIAIILYAIMLPLLLLFGHHWFMKYFVKIFDHLGKVLAGVGICFIREREM